MHDSLFLGQAALLFGTALVVATLSRALKLPTIIGFLATGLLIGPHALGLIDRESMSAFAEVGLVLLLFVIGLELAPASLLRTGKRLLVAGFVQVFVTASITALCLRPMLGAWIPAGLMGVAVALSSTAIVLKQLSDMDALRSTTGKVTVGLLLLQDLLVVLVLVLLPLLMPSEAVAVGFWPNLLHAVGAFALLAAITVAAHFALPTVLYHVLHYGGRELAAIFAVLMACGGAWLAGRAGWPLALGACVAGFLLAKADVRHQLVAEITPFRDVFNALFFISLGMMVNLRLSPSTLFLLLLAIALTLVGKTLITSGAVFVAGWPSRPAVQIGIGLCTVSEFSYVLMREAYRAGLVTESLLGGMVAYAVGTMMVGAILFPLSERMAMGLSMLFRKDRGRDETEDEESPELSSHVIIIGYGVNGRNLTRVLRSTHIPHCVVEMNPSRARAAVNDGAHVIIGDATRMAILRHAGLARARALVVATPDEHAAQRIVAQVRAEDRELYIAVRAYAPRELEALFDMGANSVVSADFEASVEIFSHVLHQFSVPDNVINAQIASVRAGGYGVLRGLSSGRPESVQELVKILRMTATQTLYLSEGMSACGKSLSELDLRARTGVTVIAVVRHDKPATNPPADFRLEAGDVLILLGAHAQLSAAQQMLKHE